MEKPLLTLKPSIANALIPVFIKNLSYSFIVVLILFGVALVLRVFNLISYPTTTIITWLIVPLFVIPIFPVLTKLIILQNTKYYFFRTHVLSEFEFVRVRHYSVPYHHIVNITTDVSVWDRPCNAGDVTLHTAEDRAPDLILHYVKDPEKVESTVYQMVHRHRRAPARQ